ncbi:MAG TPA: cysteine hydrolase [Microbacteriaceae bacterium]|nr:cysteine hydrolase [Microbacteriaceae bacterium]
MPRSLVVIDMQRVFAEPPSPWAAPAFDRALAGTRRLLPAFSGRTVFTRYVAPLRPQGAWIPYFEQWPFALVAHDDPLYEIVPELREAAEHAVVETRESFGKWDDGLAAATGGAREIVLAGVSTDCCVIATALAAGDAGVRVRVAADACAGASEEDHERALAAMALFAPLVEVTTVDALLD